MTLVPGTRLGAYKIVEQIGVEGMGEVYRATDTKLHRDVAIKFSAGRFSERFARDARAVAALNHPNICTLHDISSDYVVMELVEGLTLAERIKQGAVPLDEALGIARQIASALKAVHDKGIVHRDLKPGNVIVQPDGRVKILDIGLARVGGMQTESDDSPYATTSLTAVGVILGPSVYMSPEQASGMAVDKRSDIWAFGVVLYEMLTGKQLFQAKDVTQTPGAVLKEQPDLSEVPAKVRMLLQRCLEKDGKKRLPDIAEAMQLLELGTLDLSAAPPEGSHFFLPSDEVARSVLARQTPATAWRAGSSAASLVHAKRDIATHLLRYLGTLARRASGSGQPPVTLFRGNLFEPNIAEALRERLGVSDNRPLGALAREFRLWLATRSNRYDAPWGSIRQTETSVELTPAASAGKSAAGGSELATVELIPSTPPGSPSDGQKTKA